MGRAPCCAKVGLNRGAWTREEDKILTDYVKSHGEGGWRNLPKQAGLKRCGKSCRLRWLNYLRPDIKRGNISQDEEDLIIRLHSLLGNRWSLIAKRLPGRTDNEVKNYWNTTMKKKMKDNNKTKELDKIPPKIRPISMVSAAGIEIEYKVIRTKAYRCTKVFVTTPPPPPPPPQPQTQKPEIYSSMLLLEAEPHKDEDEEEEEAEELPNTVAAAMEMNSDSELLLAEEDCFPNSTMTLNLEELFTPEEYFPSDFFWKHLNSDDGIDHECNNDGSANHSGTPSCWEEMLKELINSG